MNSPLHLLVVDGKTIVKTASLPQAAKGQPVHIKAINGGKYLLSSGDNQAAPDHIVVKRVGKDLQVFTQDGDDTPEIIIDGFYDHQGELSGMSADGSYHTYVNQDGSDRDAFLLLDDSGASTLILGSDSTAGLEGLAAATGLSNGMIAFGALAALAALTGIALAASNHNSHHKSDSPPPMPTGSVAEDHVGAVQGKIPQNGLTDDSKPMFSGNATSGNTVNIYDNGKLIGSAVAGTSGSWQFKPETALAEGPHSISFSEVNAGGMESPHTPPMNFIVDTTPPAEADVISLTDGNDLDLTHGGLTKNGDVRMSGDGATPGDVVRLYDGDKPIGSAVVQPDGSWSVPGTIVGDGKHDLSVGITDPAGNESSRSVPIPVDLDTTAPAAPAPSLEDGNGLDLTHGGLTNNGNLDMSGTGGAEGDIVKVYDGATLIGSTVVNPDGSWTVPGVISGDGTHDLSASYTDPAGNESAKSTPIAVDLDTTAPAAPMPHLEDGNHLDLTAGGLTNNGSLEMSGTGGSKGDIVKLYDGATLIGSAVVGEGGVWTVPGTIAGDGIHPISASFTDPAGNESAKSAPIAVDLDTVAPAAPAPTLEDGNDLDLTHGGITNNGSLEMSGTGGTEGDIVKLYDGATLIGSASVGPGGVWTVPGAISGDGTHPISASFTDPAGNESLKSAPIAVELDTTAPAAPAAPTLEDGAHRDLTAGGATNNGNLDMSGTGGTEGDIVKLYDGDTLIGSGVVGPGGVWTAPGVISGEGNHPISASFTDPAGNEGARSAPIAVELDTTAPTTTLVLDNNQPSFSGVTEGDAIVTIYDGTTLLGSVKAEPNGSWTWRPTGTLADGTYHYNATAQDKLGNTSGHTANLDFKVASTVNDFDDTTGQGWTVTASHAADTRFTGSNVEIKPGGAMAAGEIMYRELTVQAGHTYQFSYRNISWYSSAAVDYMSAGVSINGTPLGNPGLIYNGTATYSWTATTGGVVRVAIFTNDTSLDAGNWVTLDNFTIRDSAPLGATSVSSMGVQNHDDTSVPHDDSISSMSVQHDESNAAVQHDTHQTESAPSTTVQQDNGADHFQLSGNALHLNDTSAVIDLSNVAQQHSGDAVHSLSLEGHGSNVLNVNINDVLAMGSEDLFLNSGSTQLMIKGDAGDTVNLETVNGDKSPEQWNAQGEVTLDGTTYNVYQNSDHEVDVLIQQGVQVQQH